MRWIEALLLNKSTVGWFAGLEEGFKMRITQLSPGTGISILLSLLISACGSGGGNGDSSGDRSELEANGVDIDYSTLSNLTPSESGFRVASSSEEVKTLFLNGQRQRTLVTGGGSAKTTPATQKLGSSFQSSASDTSTSAVDSLHGDSEYGDIVQYDGDNLFVSKLGSFEILTADANNASIVEKGKLVLSDIDANIDNIFLSQENTQTTAATLISSGRLTESVNFPENPDIQPEDYSSNDLLLYTAISINHVDITDTANPKLDWNVLIEGDLVKAHKTDNTLYVTSRHDIYISGLVRQNPMTEETKAQNEQVLRNTSLLSLLPKFSINRGKIQSLVKPEECMVPNNLTKKMVTRES